MRKPVNDGTIKYIQSVINFFSMAVVLELSFITSRHLKVRFAMEKDRIRVVALMPISADSISHQNTLSVWK